MSAESFNGSIGFQRSLVDPPAKQCHGLSRALESLPTLTELAEEWRGTRVLSGVSGYFALHFFSNLCGFLKAAEWAGLDLNRSAVFFKGAGYRYLGKERVKSHLRGVGFAVRPVTDITKSFVETIHARAVKASDRIIIVEDGGFFSPIIARLPHLATHIRGIVEQTSRGERLLNETKRRIQTPVLSIAKAALKKPEADYVADGTVQATQAMMPNHSLRNKRTAVLGLSDIGRAVVLRLAENCSPPTMYDPLAENQVVALKLCGHLEPTAIHAIRDADVIFGCSGHTSISADEIPHLKHRVKLVSTSSEDVEFDKAALARMGTPIPLYRDGRDRKECSRIGTRYTMHGTGKVVDLLADGFPVNFFFADYGGMGDAQADLTMSLLYLSLIAIAKGDYKNRKGLLHGEVDKLAKKHQLADRFMRYHR